MDTLNSVTTAQQSQPTPAVILAGGFGKRLRSVIDDSPKSLAPIAGRPFLDYLMGWLKRFRFTDLVICVGYRAEEIQRHYDDGAKWGLRISYSKEAEPLGTAGAIKNAEQYLRTPSFLVVNGDSFVDVNLSSLVLYHQRRQALATLALVPAPSKLRYGSVRLDASDKILGFFEKNSSGVQENAQIPQWINAGVYVFQREFLGCIPGGQPVSLEMDVFPKLVGQNLIGFSSDSYFIDIGVPEDYARAQKDFEERFPQ